MQGPYECHCERHTLEDYLSFGALQLWLHANSFAFTTGTVDNQCWKKCLRYSIEFFAIGLEARSKLAKTIIHVGWEKPLWGWLKLNSDGSAINNPDKAGGGGLFRDHEVLGSKCLEQLANREHKLV